MRDLQFEIQTPRADLHAPRLEVIVRDEGEPLDEPVVEAVEVVQDRFGCFGARYDAIHMHLKRAPVVLTAGLNRECSAGRTPHGRRARPPAASRR